MRSFITACLVAAGMAVGAAVILNGLVQESSSNAYSAPSVRI